LEGSDLEGDFDAAEGRCAAGTRARYGRRLQVEADRADVVIVAGRDDAGFRRSRVVGREQVVALGAEEGGRASALCSERNARAFLDHVSALCDDEGCRAFLGSQRVQLRDALRIDVGAGGIAGEGRRRQAGEQATYGGQDQCLLHERLL
jgi:hypothetical protein